MKKFIAKLILATILFTNISTTSRAFYKDVEASHPYHNAIESLYKEGKLPTTENFAPDQLINIKDFYEILSKYTNSKVEHEKNPKATISEKKAIKIIKSISTIKSDNLNSENSTHKRITKAQAAELLHTLNNSTTTTKKQPTQTLKVVPIKLASKYTQTENELLNDPEFKKLLNIWSIIQNEYLYKEEVDNKELIKGAIEGLTEKLNDKYTNFQSAEETDSFNATFSGEYEGVGMSVELIDNKVTVVTPLKESPAEKVGLKPNDIIVKVNDENVLGKSVLYVTSKIKGPANTNVKLTILRGTTEIDFTVERKLIIRKSVEHEIMKNSETKIGYINVINFGAKTYEEFVSAANELIKENPKGILIDLRNNPGGYLNTAVGIVGLFDRQIKTAAKLRYTNGKEVKYETSGNGMLADYRTVILVNEGSASASEIMAGALQDYEKATVVGQYTYGKGTAQQLKAFQDGATFKYTNAKWLTPNGRDLDKTGIRPNIIVKNSLNNDLQLEKALSLF